MVQPFFNIVVIKAEYYEVYAEFRLLSCEHKIFIVKSTAIVFPHLLLVTVTIWLSL